MKKLLIIIPILLIVVLVIGYFVFKGKIPLLSNAVFKQIDLGIDESPDIIYEYYDEIGYKDNLKGTTPKSGELVFEGGIEIEKTFSLSEMEKYYKRKK
jgi:hypothetical protein